MGCTAVAPPKVKGACKAGCCADEDAAAFTPAPPGAAGAFEVCGVSQGMGRPGRVLAPDAAVSCCAMRKDCTDPAGPGAALGGPVSSAGAGWELWKLGPASVGRLEGILPASVGWAWPAVATTAGAGADAGAARDEGAAGVKIKAGAEAAAVLVACRGAAGAGRDAWLNDDAGRGLKRDAGAAEACAAKGKLAASPGPKADWLRVVAAGRLTEGVGAEVCGGAITGAGGALPAG